MALRDNRDVRLDSGSANLDKSEATIPETVCHPDRRENDHGGPFKSGNETGRQNCNKK